MPTEIHTIGVCNGRDDCPGLDAVIRAVVQAAAFKSGWRVIGVTNSFSGLIWPEQLLEFTPASIRSVTIADSIGMLKRADPMDDHARVARADRMTFGDRP